MDCVFYVCLLGMKIEIMKDFFKKTFDLIKVIGLCLVLTIVPVDAAMPDGTDAGQGSNPDDPTQILLGNELSEETENTEEDDESENDKKSSDKSEKTSDNKNTFVDNETESETPEGLSVTPTGVEAKPNKTVDVTEPKATETNNSASADGEDINTSKNEKVSDESGKTSGENELSEKTEGNQLSEETTSKVNDTKSSEIENQETEADASVLKENTLNNSNQAQTTVTEGKTALLGTNPASDTNEDAATTETPKKGEYPARENAEIENKYNDLIEGVAYIPSSGNSADEDLPVRYVYSDKYFEGSSIISEESGEKNFNYDLAALSAIVANCSGYSSRAKMDDNGVKPNPDAPENQSKNIQTILRELGFENIETNDFYKQEGNPFSVGILCATKKIEFEDGGEYTLLGIFPRSFGYSIEWADNGAIGGTEGKYNGDAYGPSFNVDKVLIPFIKKYLNDNEITGDLKIWSTGVSRGGGLSMLTSAYIDNQLDDGSTNSLFGIEKLRLKKEDIFTYTFGAPNWAYETNAGTVTENTETDKNEFTPYPLYSNIHNFAVDYDILYTLFTGEPGDSWGLVHYGSDNVLEESVAKETENLQMMINQYTSLLQTDENGLIETGFFFKNKETKELEYKPFMSDYSYDGNPYELAAFLTEYMAHVTSESGHGLDRNDDFFKDMPGVQAFLTVFLGQRSKINKFTAEITKAGMKEIEIILETAANKYDTEGREAAIKYLKEELDPKNFSANVITEAFETAEIKYRYDFTNRPEKPESDPEIDKTTAVNLYREQYIPQMLDFILKLAINDSVTNTYQMYRAAGNLWSAHDVNIYASWMRGFSSESNYYLNKLNDGEKWGYRMVYLPESVEGFEINVYHGGKNCVKIDGLVGATLDGTIKSDKYYREDGFDPYVHVTYDSKGNRVLYLRSDREYIIEFVPQNDQTNSEGITIDEYQYEHSYKIFEPFYTIEEDDYSTKISQIAQLIKEGKYSLVDKLFLEIGAVKEFPPAPTPKPQETNKMLNASALLTENSESHAAEYYLIAKLIELQGVVEKQTGGTINNKYEDLIKDLMNDGKTDYSGTLKAAPKSGYRFVGWYTADGKLVSSEVNFTKNFTYSDSSAVYYARFELIPDEKDDTEPAYIPADEVNAINIPVEIPPTVAVSSAKTYRIPKTSDRSRLDLWIMFFASLTAVGASMYLLKETE